MAKERINDRSRLRFAVEVKQQFSFLETFGFHCTHSEATLVRFESPTVSINVYHGRQSYEIGLEIESKSLPTDSYSFSEILRLVDTVQAERYRNYATNTLQGVREGVRQLAELFMRCIVGGILGDTRLFSHLKTQREELGKTYALETQLEQARKQCEEAWRKKDYAAVLKALKPFRTVLTAAEVRKLEFAKKQVGKIEN